MPKYDLPTSPLRYVTIAVSGNVPAGVVIGSSDIVEYAAIIGQAGLSAFNLPQDATTRILVWDTAVNHAVHSGALDQAGRPVWDGVPLVNTDRKYS
jgi:hypothetical protein